MPRPELVARIETTDFDRFASEIAMAVWNRIAEFPQFHHLQPRDYPPLYETVQRTLKPYQIKQIKASKGSGNQAHKGLSLE